ncbi:MAG TPA: DUF4249 family protein [Paludibacter sp.]|nr:DUF4249 family protein [Paludibacter sp.]
MRSAFSLLTFFLVLFLSSSCHNLVEEDLPDITKTPVLNGVLIADSLLKVHVSLTASMGDSIPSLVSNALVIIKSDIKTDTLRHIKNGWYGCSTTIILGKTYNCTVDVPGYKQLSAVTTVPYFTLVNDLKFNEIAGKGDYNENISSFEFSIPNDTTKELYWEIRFTFDNYIFFKAEQDSVMISEAQPLNLFSNKKMKKDEYRGKFFFTNTDGRYNSKGNSFIVLRSVDASYYKYQKQLYLYNTGGYTGLGSSTQTYPLYTNVTNGYGIFTSYSVFYKSLKYY